MPSRKELENIAELRHELYNSAEKDKAEGKHECANKDFAFAEHLSKKYGEGAAMKRHGEGKEFGKHK